MSQPEIVSFAVAGACALLDWYAVATANKRLEYVFKPAVMCALVAAALTLTPVAPAERAAFVVALVLSGSGDVFLMLPTDRFVLGLASFLGAHVAYIVGLLLCCGSPGRFAVAFLFVTAASVAPGRHVLGGVRSSGNRELIVPVSAYMTVISMMVASALASGKALAAAGAVLFYLSDLLIAWNRFVARMAWAPLAIIVTYHLAQFALVTSLAH